MSELPIVRFLTALAGDCENTDGWQEGAETARDAATLIKELVEALEKASAAIRAVGLASYSLHAGRINKLLAKARGEQ